MPTLTPTSLLSCIRVLKIPTYITRKILLPALLLLLAPYAIQASQYQINKVEPDPHRFIVRYKNEEGKANVHTAADICHTDLGPQHAIAVTLSTPEALESLQNDPNIEYVEQDLPRFPIRMRGYDSNDVVKQHMPNNNETRVENYRKLTESVPYGIPMVQADQVSYDSNNPRKICIIDSGYDLGHEDLPSTNVDGFSFDDRGYPWNQDGSGHGTHVAGTIAAFSGNGKGVIGVAPGVNLFIVRIFADDGSVILGSNVMDAVNRCKAGGANVINMSLVGIGFSRAENAAFTDLLSIDNILCVAAAGNFGNSKEGTDLQYPASYDSVVSVAAIDSNKVVAPFSQRNDQIDVAAPGVDVRSTARRGTGDFGGFLETRGGSYSGMPMLGSATGSASGVFVDCGIGDYDCTAASGQICLIQRDGVILFRDKVLACQNGGGLGAVISNNVAGNLVGDLGDADTQIPSIGISITDGEYLLANNLGNSITLTVGLSNYESLAGTSMATPHVSGVAALIWSQDPTKTAGEVRAALLNTAEDLGVPEKDNSYGYGLVQAAAACAALTGSSCAPPSSEPSSEPSAGPSLSSSPTGTSSPPSGPPSEEPSLAPSLSLELSARPSLSSSSPPSSSPTSTPVPSILDPRPFLAACSLDSDCLSNNCMDLVCRSSPTVKANKIKMSGNRGGTGGGGAKGEENRRHLWRRQTGPRGA